MDVGGVEHSEAYVLAAQVRRLVPDGASGEGEAEEWEQEQCLRLHGKDSSFAHSAPTRRQMARAKRAVSQVLTAGGRVVPNRPPAR